MFSPTYQRFTQGSQPIMLRQHSTMMIGNVIGDAWQILHLRWSSRRLRKPKGTAVSFVSSKIQSTFLVRRSTQHVTCIALLGRVSGWLSLPPVYNSVARDNVITRPSYWYYSYWLFFAHAHPIPAPHCCPLTFT